MAASRLPAASGRSSNSALTRGKAVVFLIVAAGSEAVQRIAQDVDGDGPVAAQRQAIRQPAVSRAQVGDAQRAAELLLDRRQDAALQIAIALGANRPLVLQASGDVAVRQRQIVRGVLRAAAFGVADLDVIVEEAVARGG